MSARQAESKNRLSFEGIRLRSLFALLFLFSFCSRAADICADLKVHAANPPAQKCSLADPTGTAVIAPLNFAIGADAQIRFLNLVKAEALKRMSDRLGVLQSPYTEKEVPPALANQVKQARFWLGVADSRISLPYSKPDSAWTNRKIDFDVTSGPLNNIVSGMPASAPLTAQEQSAVAKIFTSALQAPDWATTKSQFMNKDFRSESSILHARYIPKVETAASETNGHLRALAQEQYRELIEKNPLLAFVTAANPKPSDIEAARKAYAVALSAEINKMQSLDVKDPKARALALFSPAVAAVLKAHPEMCDVFSSTLAKVKSNPQNRNAVTSAMDLGSSTVCGVAALASEGTLAVPCFMIAGATTAALAAGAAYDAHREADVLYSGYLGGQTGFAASEARNEEAQGYLAQAGLLVATNIAMLGTAAAAAEKSVAETAVARSAATDISATDRQAKPASRIAATSDGSATKSYAPINTPQVVRSDTAIYQESEIKKQLNEVGIKTKSIRDEDNMTLLEILAKNDEVHLQPSNGSTQIAYGDLLEIKNMPSVNPSARATDPALSHPGMAEKLDRLHELGYKLVVDTSLPLTGRGAYASDLNKVVAILPKTPYHQLVHEVDHAEFQQLVGAHGGLFGKFVIARAAGEKLSLIKTVDPEVLKQIGSDRLAKIEKLIDRGVTTRNAISESLAIDRELATLGWRRFLPDSPGTHTYKYKLRNQIADLEDLGDRVTNQQKNLLELNKRLHDLTEFYDNRKDMILGVGPVVGVATVANVTTFLTQLNKPLTNMLESRYTEIFHDDKGHVIGKKSDGTIEYLELKPSLPN
jgi:hypothetical protein